MHQCLTLRNGSCYQHYDYVTFDRISWRCFMPSMTECARGMLLSIPQCIKYGIPYHTQSMIAYKILTKYFWKFQWEIALWECCSHALFRNNALLDILRAVDGFSLSLTSAKMLYQYMHALNDNSLIKYTAPQCICMSFGNDRSHFACSSYANISPILPMMMLLSPTLKISLHSISRVATHTLQWLYIGIIMQPLAVRSQLNCLAVGWTSHS